MKIRRGSAVLLTVLIIAVSVLLVSPILFDTGSRAPAEIQPVADDQRRVEGRSGGPLMADAVAARTGSRQDAAGSASTSPAEAGSRSLGVEVGALLEEPHLLKDPTDLPQPTPALIGEGIDADAGMVPPGADRWEVRDLGHAIDADAEIPYSEPFEANVPWLLGVQQDADDPISFVSGFVARDGVRDSDSFSRPPLSAGGFARP
jgi:hypothetical protein